uniref:Ethanolaminephosphotransferase 1 n=1 Tax=Gongylonema pulchrum TaxID=637853 RepID=A0A183DTE2_9BILA
LSNYISHPFWDRIVQFYPIWLAPNLLTLAGFGFVLFSFLVVSYFDYYLRANSDVLTEGAIPNWVWLLCSVCTFFGHVLDGTDGKQARRTGSSGPTGELFDHGLDSWSTVTFTVTLFSIFGQGEFSVPLIRQLMVLISVQVVFLVSHWEKYNTGTLYLSWGYDASQYGLTLFYLFTFFKRYEYFKFYVFDGFTLAVCFEFGFYRKLFSSLFSFDLEAPANLILSLVEGLHSKK